MDRLQAQLMAIECFFVNGENSIDEIQKIEVTKLEWDDFKDIWDIQYTVNYRDSKTLDCHELIDYYEKYDINELEGQTDIQLILI